MTSLPLPPNPSLLAILLVTKYQHDPSIVFHYPPIPGQDNSSLLRSLDIDDGEESSSSDDASTSSADGENKNEGMGDQPPDGKTVHDMDVDETGSASPEKGDGMRTPQKDSNWGMVFGHNPHFLAKLLCPARSGHKKRFEVSVNDKVYLGRPVFARESGEWRKSMRKPDVSDDEAQADTSGETDPAPKRMAVKPFMQATQDLSETSGPGSESDRQTPRDAEDLSTSQQAPKRPRDDLKQKTRYRKLRRKDNLSMFQVVFILAPPPLEYHLRTDEMYIHVVKKFSRALKWEQARSGLVAREAMAIANMTNRIIGGKHTGPNPPLAPLYHELLTASSLAKAIATVYSCISTCRIAHINLSPALSLSLQIPIPGSTAVLPNANSHQLPGLWLTTATSIPIDDEVHTGGSQLASHYTLLLLSDLHSILADVQSTDSPLAEPLAHYLRVSKPTKSFSQISQSSGIALSDIQVLASHLIYWRRARAIPPLHQRDTYIVSPNADMSKLASATSTFAKLYPALPSLPKILSLLSSTPRPYSILIPSKDHKEAYMDILAWLFRYGWVTQLRSFAWIRVPPEILKSVAGQDHHEKKLDKLDDPVQSEDGHLDVPHCSSSPTLSTHSSVHTTVPIGTTSPPLSPILLPRPIHPDKITTAQLSAISAHIQVIQGKDVQNAWDKCVKYFDGKHALETIAVRENWKRKRVGDFIADWEKMGLLRRARHW